MGSCTTGLLMVVGFPPESELDKWISSSGGQLDIPFSGSRKFTSA